MKAGKVVIGTLAGVTAGAILGMLFAPEKGEITRKNISQKGVDLADAMREKVNQYTDSVNHKIDSLKEKAVEWLERDKEMMDSQANKGNNI